MSMTDSEYSDLLCLEKTFENNSALQISPPPISWTQKIRSIRTSDVFLLDFRYNSQIVLKYTFNKRHRTSIVLLRYDSHGRHTNPIGPNLGYDGHTFNGPHVHIYKEGFDTRYALPVEALNLVEGGHSIYDAFSAICRHCNIKNPPVQMTIT